MPPVSQPAVRIARVGRATTLADVVLLEPIEFRGRTWVCHAGRSRSSRSTLNVAASTARSRYRPSAASHGSCKATFWGTTPNVVRAYGEGAGWAGVRSSARLTVGARRAGADWVASVRIGEALPIPAPGGRAHIHPRGQIPRRAAGVRHARVATRHTQTWDDWRCRDRVNRTRSLESDPLAEFAQISPL